MITETVTADQIHPRDLLAYGDAEDEVIEVHAVERFPHRVRMFIEWHKRAFSVPPTTTFKRVIR